MTRLRPAALARYSVSSASLRSCALLDRLGIRISLDDFGAGYTSLGQLTTLPISELKIDRSFVMSLPQDAGGAAIVRRVVDLGHDLGLTIVAEGVESAAALALLAELKCDIVQGYHLSKPLEIDAFDLWCLHRAVALRRPAKITRR